MQRHWVLRSGMDVNSTKLDRVLEVITHRGSVGESSTHGTATAAEIARVEAARAEAATTAATTAATAAAAAAARNAAPPATAASAYRHKHADVREAMARTCEATVDFEVHQKFAVHSACRRHGKAKKIGKYLRGATQLSFARYREQNYSGEVADAMESEGTGMRSMCRSQPGSH